MNDLYHRNGGTYQGLTAEQIAEGLQTRVEKVEKRRNLQIISYEHHLTPLLTPSKIGGSAVNVMDNGVIWVGFLPHEHHLYTGETRTKIGLLAHLQVYQELAGREWKGCLIGEKEIYPVGYKQLTHYTYTDFLEFLNGIEVNEGMQFKDCLEKLVSACGSEKLIK